MPSIEGKLVDEFSLTPETSNASSFASSTRSSNSLLRTTSFLSIDGPDDRHSGEKNRDSAVAGLRRNSTGAVVTPSRRPEPNSEETTQTYYPLHQGPSITVSSADGTSLIADAQSDSLRNAAAQSLFRALERLNATNRGSNLEGHLDKIYGAVDITVDVKDFAIVNDVKVVRKQWEADSIHPRVEDKNGGRVSRTARKMRGKIGFWFTKIFA